jgi:hypothetical protein
MAMEDSRTIICHSAKSLAKPQASPIGYRTRKLVWAASRAERSLQSVLALPSPAASLALDARSHARNACLSFLALNLNFNEVPQLLMCSFSVDQIHQHRTTSEGAGAAYKRG